MLFVVICIFTQTSNLSKEQIQKLHTSVILDKNEIFTIEKYTKVSFKPF